MKEISYEGSPYKKEESEWLKKHRRTAPPLEPVPGPEQIVQAQPIAPQRMQNIPPVSVHATEDEDHHLGMIIFILMLVLAFGIGVGAYVLIGTSKKAEPVVQQEAAVVAEINTAQYTDILLSDSPRAQILVDIALAFKNTSLAEGGVHHVTFVANDVGGKSRPATVSEIFQAVRSERIPDSLFHSLETALTYEIRSGTPPAGKITLTSRSAAHTYGALFDWEQGLSKTLIPLLHPLLNTSYLRDIEERKFHDERIDGTDVRVLVDIMGDVVIIYGFTDPKTLVIAGSREAFLSGARTEE